MNGNDTNNFGCFVGFSHRQCSNIIGIHYSQRISE